VKQYMYLTIGNEQVFLNHVGADSLIILVLFEEGMVFFKTLFAL